MVLGDMLDKLDCVSLDAMRSKRSSAEFSPLPMNIFSPEWDTRSCDSLSRESTPRSSGRNQGPPTPPCYKQNSSTPEHFIRGQGCRNTISCPRPPPRQHHRINAYSESNTPPDIPPPLPPRNTPKCSRPLPLTTPRLDCNANTAQVGTSHSSHTMHGHRTSSPVYKCSPVQVVYTHKGKPSVHSPMVAENKGSDYFIRGSQLSRSYQPHVRSSEYREYHFPVEQSYNDEQIYAQILDNSPIKSSGNKSASKLSVNNNCLQTEQHTLSSTRFESYFLPKSSIDVSHTGSHVPCAPHIFSKNVQGHYEMPKQSSPQFARNTNTYLSVREKRRPLVKASTFEEENEFLRTSLTSPLGIARRDKRKLGSTVGKAKGSTELMNGLKPSGVRNGSCSDTASLSSARIPERQERCAVCGFKVDIDRFCVQRELYHKSCFKCCRCDQPLTLKSYRKQGTDSPLYCEAHLPSCTLPRKITGARPYDRSVSAMDETTHQELLSLLDRMQGTRLDDQRCELPAYPASSADSPPTNGVTISARTIQEEGEDTISGLLECAVSGKSKMDSPGSPPVLEVPGYWTDQQLDDVPVFDNEVHLVSLYSLEMDEVALSYRTHFWGKEHTNYVAMDDKVGPVILSVRSHDSSNGECIRVILRRKSGTKHEVVPAACLQSNPNPAKIAKALFPDISTEKFHAVTDTKGTEKILSYDEHLHSKTYKFGVVYQHAGQTTEEEVFGNNVHSPAFEEFLQVLGTRVQLKDYKGYRGGLDVLSNQTGLQSVSTHYQECEIMFHISTLLPYTPGDPQQLQRKRHIGNDIVTIIFQDDSSTSFAPNMIASKFLHVFVVVKAVKYDERRTLYKVSVAARDDVPFFGPKLPDTCTFENKEDFRDFLLAKLINGERAAYKSDQFARLGMRTREALLDGLYQQLCPINIGATFRAQGSKSDSSTGLLSTFKRAISGKNKKYKFLQRNLSDGVHIQKRRPSDTDSADVSTPSAPFIQPENDSMSSYKTCSPDSSPNSSPNSTSATDNRLISISQSSSSSSINSFAETAATNQSTPNCGHQLEDSDTGMESMSSAEMHKDRSKKLVNNEPPDTVCTQAEDSTSELENLKEEIERLKMERQNLIIKHKASQEEIERLKGREGELSHELQETKQQLQKLKMSVMDISPEATV